MAYDANNVIQTSTTATTVAVTSAGFNTLTGTPRRGMKARVAYNSASAATVGCVWTVKVQKSADNTTYIDASYGEPLTATTAAVGGEQFIPVTVDRNYPWVRSVLTPLPTTGSPNIVYQVNLGISYP